MVFVNLGKKPSQRMAYPHEYKCLNCGKALEQPFGGIDARRFCNNRCKEDYFSS